MSSSKKKSGDFETHRDDDEEFWAKVRLEAAQSPFQTPSKPPSSSAQDVSGPASAAPTSEASKPTPPPPAAPSPAVDDPNIKSTDQTHGWYYVQYNPERESEYLPAMRQLIAHDLSEPYSIYVYRYFLYTWPDLCFLCLSSNDQLLGVIINKLEPHVPPSCQHLTDEDREHLRMRGYIAMIATHSNFRKKGIARQLVQLGVTHMATKGAVEIVLETEVDNLASLRLYQGLGFLKSKRLWRYYLNGNEAFRLVLGVDRKKIAFKRELARAAAVSSPSDYDTWLLAMAEAVFGQGPLAKRTWVHVSR
ncbi:MAG: hypothetical protein Q9162_004304 [Coniocarpon cinnabarinum]